MPLETGTYISDLDATNPLAGDETSRGDDHLRLLKSVLKNSLPTINAAVTATVAQINGWEARIAAIESAHIKKDGSVAFTGVVSGIDPTLAAHLATKGYVDTATGPTTKVSSFNTRTGAVTLTSGDVTTALGYTPWHAGNDGAGSGLDADLLDGQSSAYYTDITARQGFPSAPKPSGGAGTGLGDFYSIAPTGTTTALPGTGAQQWAYIYGLGGAAAQVGVAAGGTVISTPDTGQRILVWRVL